MSPRFTARSTLTRWALLALAATVAARAEAQARIDHLMVIVFDQMRPDYIDRFDLPNFKKLRSESAQYTNAYLGYMGSETIVSHLVIPTGMAPKDLPWADDFFRDVHGELGAPNAFYQTGSLTLAQYTQLMSRLPKERFLAYRLKQKLGGTVWGVGEKTYAALVYATPYADSAVTLNKADGGQCVPYGGAVPSYIAADDRFRVDCTKTYGSEKTYYPLDGAQFVPGDDPAHLGGDVWTADVALDLMRHEQWSGLFLTFGAIDKVGHMLGEEDASFVTPFHADYHLKDVAKIADDQLGRVLGELEKQRLRQRTLIVVTADHGGQSSTTYLGNGTSGKWGSLGPGEHGSVPPALAELARDPDVLFGFQDSAIRLWLKSDTSPARQRAVKALQRTPGVVEIYALEKSASGWHYRRVYSAVDQQPEAFRRWAAQHNQEIVDQMANEQAPHLVGLAADGVGFGLLGDHGGAQERVQRVPLFVAVPGQEGKVITQPITTMEISGLIERRLGL